MTQLLSGNKTWNYASFMIHSHYLSYTLSAEGKACLGPAVITGNNSYRWPYAQHRYCSPIYIYGHRIDSAELRILLLIYINLHIFIAYVLRNDSRRKDDNWFLKLGLSLPVYVELSPNERLIFGIIRFPRCILFHYLNRALFLYKVS